MAPKHTFLLLLVFIVHSKYGMENNKKNRSFSQILTNFVQRCEAERVLWRQGYMSHTQQIYPKQSVQRPIHSISPSIKKNFTEQDMQTYLLTQ